MEDKKKCEQVRELLELSIESSDLLADGDRGAADEHLAECRPCSSWKEQSADIIDLARSLPTFDVSEKLTQSILTQIAVEETAKQKQLGWIVYAVAVVTFIWLLVVVDAYESIWGVGSWLVGLGTMLALKALVSESPKEHQPAN